MWRLWICVCAYIPKIGRMFDKDGNLVQWWSEDVIHKFKEQAQCIVDQYSNYTVEEVGMNVSPPTPN